MVGVIVLTDQLIFRPVVAWAQKFKVEAVESSDTAQSLVLRFIRRSRLVDLLERKSIEPTREKLLLHYARQTHVSSGVASKTILRRWLAIAVAFAAGLAPARPE